VRTNSEKLRALLEQLLDDDDDGTAEDDRDIVSCSDVLAAVRRMESNLTAMADSANERLVSIEDEAGHTETKIYDQLFLLQEKLGRIVTQTELLGAGWRYDPSIKSWSGPSKAAPTTVAEAIANRGGIKRRKK
jgi:hypothetical protein